jgi:oxygen-dependent protoporphyrinogen oxidase
MARVIIVGGGVSGLGAARAILARDPSADVTVLESGTRLGGNVRTVTREGRGFDAGPEAVPKTPLVVEALADLGLDGAAIPPARAPVLVAHGGRLLPLPSGLAAGTPDDLRALAATPLLTGAGKARAALGVVLPRNHANSESAGALVEAQFGREVKERIFAPLYGAIHAADVDRLDPALVTAILGDARRGVLSAAKGKRVAPPALVGLRGGMTSFVRALERRVGAARIVTGVRVDAIDRRDSVYRVWSRGSFREADHVVLAAPTAESARLLATLDRDLATPLDAISTVSTATVLLGLPGKVELPHATGMLFADAERHASLAMTIVTAKWHGGVGDTVLRIAVGGARSPRLVSSEHAEGLVEMALADLRTYLPLPSPRWSAVTRFWDAVPVMERGHAGRVAALREGLSSMPGLHVLGAFARPGIASCLEQASAVAAAIAA